MSTQLILILCQCAVIAYALVAGVFLTFSDFVMASLKAAQPAGGIESMQIINRKVFRTVFMVLLIGMSVASPLLIRYSASEVGDPASLWVTSGALIYIVGVFLVTLIFNVPMNTRLDRMDFDSSEAAAYWQHYVPRWSFWNWVRAIASTMSAVCLLIACISLANT